VATIFDAADYAPSDRLPAFEAILASTSCPTAVRAERDLIGDRLDGWQVGESGYLIRSLTGGQRQMRTNRHVRLSAPERVSLAVNLRGRSVGSNRGTTMVDNQRVRLIDLTNPHENLFDGPALSHAFEIGVESLHVRIDDLRAAQTRLTASPVHDLVVAHLQMLPKVLDAQAGTSPPAATATVQLLRALVGSVVSDDKTRRESLHETQLARVDAYITQHLHEPDLTPARVAAAQFISLRQLYKLFAARSDTPARWIIKQRLAVGGCPINGGSDLGIC
jgi:hypothetical protein